MVEGGFRMREGGLFEHLRTHRAVGTGASRRDLFSGESELSLHDAADAQSRIERLLLGSVSLGRVTSTGHDVHLAEHLGVTLVVPRQGLLTSETPQGTYRAGPKQALLFSPNRRRTRVEPDNARYFEGIPVIVPVRELAAAAERLGVARRPAWSADLFTLLLDETRSSASAELIQLVGVVASEAGRGSRRLADHAARDGWGQLLAEKIVEVLGDADLVGLPADGGSTAAHGRVRTAVEYMRANSPDITSVVEVAAACGVSVRTLELAFREVMDCGPYAYLGLVRLEEARRMLIRRNGEATVTEIAHACGFSHMGRFSSAYRQRYGEAPSATARGRLRPNRRGSRIG